MPPNRHQHGDPSPETSSSNIKQSLLFLVIRDASWPRTVTHRGNRASVAGSVRLSHCGRRGNDHDRRSLRNVTSSLEAHLSVPEPCTL